METKTKVVSCRLPEKLAELLKRYCEADMHVNPADFIRDAIREKLERDFPEIRKFLLKELSLDE